MHRIKSNSGIGDTDTSSLSDIMEFDDMFKQVGFEFK